MFFKQTTLRFTQTGSGPPERRECHTQHFVGENRALVGLSTLSQHRLCGAARRGAGGCVCQRGGGVGGADSCRAWSAVWCGVVKADELSVERGSPNQRDARSAR